MALLTRRRILAGKIETTIGTAVALTNTDAGFRVMDRDLRIVSNTVHRDNQGGFGVANSVAGARHVEGSWKLHAAGSGASGAVPAWASLFLPACGMPITTATAALTSDQTNWKALTVGAYMDGIRVLGRGMQGNLKLNFTAGEPVELEFDNWMGAFEESPTDTAILSGMTYESVTPPVFSGAGSLSLGSASTYCKISKMTIDLGNVVTLRPDPNKAGGYHSALITNRVPRVTLDPETVLMAVRSFGADHVANTEIALGVVLGTTQYNIMTLSVGAMIQARNAPFGDREGKVISDLDYLVCNDSMSIVWS